MDFEGKAGEVPLISKSQIQLWVMFHLIIPNGISEIPTSELKWYTAKDYNSHIQLCVLTCIGAPDSFLIHLSQFSNPHHKSSGGFLKGTFANILSQIHLTLSSPSSSSTLSLSLPFFVFISTGCDQTLAQ